MDKRGPGKRREGRREPCPVKISSLDLQTCWLNTLVSEKVHRAVGLYNSATLPRVT